MIMQTIQHAATETTIANLLLILNALAAQSLLWCGVERTGAKI
jgi:hypothetical protein